MVMSFQDALQLSGNDNKTVLLGNGFSIACDDVFNYRSLLENSNVDNTIRDIFVRLETADFEVIINRFESAAQLIEMYTNEQEQLISQLRRDSQVLRGEFARVIANKHVNFNRVFRMVIVNNMMRECDCLRFLSNFSKIFTTNYDLLLYWSIMRSLERSWRRRRQNQERELIIPTNDEFNPNDGFTRLGDDQPLRYGGGIDQNVFYLHGSLFLLQDGFDILKMERDTNEGLNLLPIISNGIRNNEILPLIVLEGSSANKLSKISEHLYLSEALNNLSKLDGSLFIHGHSLDRTDQHIFEAINRGSVTQIFISIINDESAEEMSRQAILRLGNNQTRQIYL